MAQPTSYWDDVIDAFGGTSAVAKLTEAPTSTVHSWRKNGIPPSRMSHLKLLADIKGVPLPTEPDTRAGLDHAA